MKYQHYNNLIKDFFCLILLFLVLMSASVTHAEKYKSVARGGSYVTGDEQFITPSCVAVGSSGNVDVADSDNSRIQNFDGNGNFIPRWNSKGSNENGTNSKIVQGPEDSPVAEFSANPRSGSAPLTVKFTDRSVNATGWSWDFGDGDTSTAQNPTHVYSEVGSYTASLTVTNANGTDSASTTINVLRETPTITWDNPEDISYGTALSGTQLNAVASVPGTLTYNPAAGIVLSAGSHTLRVAFTPTDTANYDTVSKEVTINVIDSRITPIITWNNPDDIPSGTALSGTQLNAVASIDGVFTYTPAAGTILNVGTHILHVDFIPFDTANYYTASKDVFINVLEQQAHPGTYKFVTKWGSYGSNDGQFNSPKGVAVDSSGNVYVVDQYNYRIQKFDSNGNFTTKWGILGNGDGEFWDPYGVSVDSSDNIYVADFNNHRIQKFDSKGNFAAKWGSEGFDDGQFWYPHDVAVDSSGNVYVADNSNRIQKFDSNGNFINKWGSYGTSYGQFKNPEGIAVDSSGNVYVVDSGNHRIQKFDNKGNFLTKWGTLGNIDGRFYYPQGVAVDSLNNVYVADNNNHRIQKFDNKGNFITKWGSVGFDDGQFYYPYRVAVDSSGNVYVVDSQDYIQKFAKNKITPIITWNNLADIIYGTALNSIQLNATSSVPGTFTYTPAIGTVLSAGTHELQVNFTPYDTANYTTASRNVIINVSALPVFPSYTKPPTDPNNDGLYEDVNGNGIQDFDDVVAFYDNMDWIGVNATSAFFDYNNNSLIDFDDIVKLYDML